MTGSAPVFPRNRRNWTDQQAAAILARDVSVALSAGAGCGKTFVLTERFLSHLEPEEESGVPPLQLSQLVAITFTERAAREMRDRIRLKCYERLQAAQGDAARYWLELMRGLDAARVSTIHSFCASLLRSHAVEAQLDPRFEVLDAAQSNTLLAELIDDRLRSGLAEHEALTLDLATEFGLNALRHGLQLMVEALGAVSAERWLAMTADELLACWDAYHTSTIIPLVLLEIAQSDHAQQMLKILAESHISHPVLLQRKATLTEQLPNLPSSQFPRSDLEALHEAAKVQGAGRKQDWEDEDVYEQYKNHAADLRALVKAGQAALGFDREAARVAAELGLKLLALASEIDRLYQQKKLKLGKLDFADLMSKTLALVTAPEQRDLRRRLSSQIRLLLVDEFQDTDPLQVELVKTLCGEGLMRGKLLFVGDFKQSIYRFRGADPEVFRQLQDATPKAGRLPLTLNFRSQPAILHFVNALFCAPFGESYQALEPQRAQVAPTPAIELLWTPATENMRERGAADRLRQQEADRVARRICNLLESEEEIVWDREAASRGEPRARRVKPGDVAILFRALSDVRHYENALRNYGIDYYLVGGHAFYAQQEIFDLLNLLRAIANPGDQLSLAGVLRSPMFSLTDETLFWLAQHPDGLRAGLMAIGLQSSASSAPPFANLDEAARQRTRAAATLLTELSQRKDRVPIVELIQYALARTGYDATLLAEFLGQRKLANLHKLVDQARSFDRSGVFGLADFIVQLSRFVAEQPREPLAATHPETTNVVRLMTIHQSKGLEFPVVIVPDIDRKGHARGSSVALTSELGPLVKPPGLEAVCGYDLHHKVAQEEERREQVRLFYVACTRAADYLILSGGMHDLEKPQGAWAQLLAERFDLKTGVFLGNLPPGYAPPQVRATLEMPTTERKPLGKTHSRGANLGTILEQAVDQAGAVNQLVTNHRPISPDAGARRRFSFSRLTGLLTSVGAYPDVLEIAPGPSGSQARIDPLGMGSLVHAVLQRINFGKTGEDAVTALARRYAPQHVVEPGAAIAEMGRLVSAFLQSQRARQIADSRQLHRELEFLLAWPLDQAPQPAGLYLQGVIDCLYQDSAGDWHLVDYKTNEDVTPQNLRHKAAQYKLQLGVYALAMEQAFGKPPGELVLCFLRPELEFAFDWNDNFRAEVVENIHQALASYRNTPAPISGSVQRGKQKRERRS